MSSVGDFDYDFLVIGAGSGGVRAARVASELGAKVAIVENYRYGGTCVIRGCVPKKLMLFASQFYDQFNDSQGYGWSLQSVTFNWHHLMSRLNHEVSRLSSVYYSNLNKSNVHCLDGTAVIVGENTVEVDGQIVRAEHILIATGARPFLPKVPGIEYAISSNHVFHLKDLPESILVVGGGYIALEFAGVFNGLGATTTLCHRGMSLLRGFDEDVKKRIHAEILKKGIGINLGQEVKSIEKLHDGRLLVHLSGESQSIVVDSVLFATGRVPNLGVLGQNNVGIQLSASGGVSVDEFGFTNVKGIYAVGDVTNQISLTPVAIRQGEALAKTLFGKDRISAKIDVIPTAVFSQPSIGVVGLTEDQALEKFDSIDVYSADFRGMYHALADSDERVFLKLIVDSASQVVVGAHMVGSDAAEIIQGIGIAVNARLTKAQFDSTVALHPSVAEEFVTLRSKVTKVRSSVEAIV